MAPPATRPLATAPELVRDLRAVWPIPHPMRGDGYRPLPLERLRVTDAARLAGSAAVVVVTDEARSHAALPLVDDGGWRIAGPGDGAAARLLEVLASGRPGMPRRPGFHVAAFAPLSAGDGSERTLGTDQTNSSVVVDDRVIVKWRTAVEADGSRALALRRHLAEVRFSATPPLLGALTWDAIDGTSLVLADVDAFLPDAQDGWDAFVAELIDHLEAPAAGALGLARALGRLAGTLHSALASPSSVIGAPVREVGRDAVDSWRQTGLGLVDRVAGLDADDAHVVRARADALRRDVEALQAIDSTSVQPVHGDLHIGQVIRWREGLAVIDFDGPPGARPVARRPEPFERGPAARDLAQLLCSLDLLAVVADSRTDGRHEAALRWWTGAARDACLGAYLLHAPPGLLDERLLAPFLAAQLCRELVYAAETLPRWRYAPVGALRWRYPEDVS